MVKRAPIWYNEEDTACKQEERMPKKRETRRPAASVQDIPPGTAAPAEREEEMPVREPAPVNPEPAATDVPAAAEERVAAEGNTPAAGEAGAGSAEREGETPAVKAQGEQYTRAELRSRRRKNIIFGLVSLAIMVCVISVLFQLSNSLAGGDSATFSEMIAGLDWRYLLVVVALFIIAFVCDSLKFTVLNRCNGYHLGFHKDMKMALTGKYYDAITPTGSGGQPMQIYYLYKQGMPGAKSTSVTMVKYGIQMLAWTIFGAVVMIALAGTLGAVEDVTVQTTIRVCAWIGFGINAFIPVFVTFVIFCPRAVSWLINLIIRLLHKIRLIKNADKLEVKIRNWMDDFAAFSQFVYKRPLIFLLLLALCLVEPITEMLIPYFLLVALCGQYVTPGIELCLTVVGLAMYATNAATFIPTPGNSGAIESVFMLAFAGIAESVLFWYVLIWRFVLYYVFIALGVGMNIFDVITGFLRRRREKKRASAQAEGEPPPEALGKTSAETEAEVPPDAEKDN